MSKSKGITRCGGCHEFGHNRRRCEVSPAVPQKRGFSAANADYQANRTAGICDDCGRPSKRFARCKSCRERRRLWPSRQPERRALEGK